MANPIERLYKAVLQTGDADPASSRTALLLHAGRGKIGKEVAEEAIEVAFEAMQKNRDAVVHSSADLLFNLVVAVDFDRSRAEARLEGDEPSGSAVRYRRKTC